MNDLVLLRVRAAPNPFRFGGGCGRDEQAVESNEREQSGKILHGEFLLSKSGCNFEH
jgi:hypothetical protein